MRKTRVTQVNAYLHAEVRQEGNYFVSRCLVLPVVSQGTTPSEAMGNLIEATQLFLETCVARGTLEQVLTKYHWVPQLHPPTTGTLGRNEVVLPVPIPAILAKRASRSSSL